MPTRPNATTAKSKPLSKRGQVSGSAGKRAETRAKASVPKRETLNLRIKREDRALIDRAADLSGKSRTDFLLEAGRRAATDTLLDRSFFLADASTFAAFVNKLDAPPQPNERLKRMLQEPAPWDK